VSDTSMAASGTSKKVTVNQILGSGGTATLASATITGAATVGSNLGVTGDLTVATSILKVTTSNVGIGTATPNTNANRTSLTLNNASWGGQLDINVGAVNHASFGTDNFSSGLSCRIQSADGIVLKTTGGILKQISSAGVFTFQDGAGGTRMTLNSTGLLVGTTNDLTGANISSSKGLGTANIATNRFATVEYGSGASGAFTTITISFAVTSASSSVIIEALLTGFSGVYLDHVAGKYSNQAGVVIRNNASVGTSVAALAVDGTGLIYTLTITTSATHPVIKVKATVGGLGQTVTLPVITFA